MKSPLLNRKWTLIQALGILVFFLTLSGVVAYNSGLAPAILGHDSSEISFGLETYYSDCTSTGSGGCYAVCPLDSGAIHYSVFSGSCIALSPVQWLSVGTLASAGPGSDPIAWQCVQNGHTPGELFVASVICLKGGA